VGSINAHIKYYAKAAKEIGLKYEFPFKNKSAVFIYDNKGQRHLFHKSVIPINSHSSASVSKNKHKTIKLLQYFKVPVPQHYQVSKYPDFIAACRKIGTKVVVKPVDQKGGKGVTVLPKVEELEKAYETAKKYSSKIIVEEFIPGINYRFIVLDDSVIAVAVRYPPFIEGDGHSTVERLLNDFNTLRAQQRLPRVKLDEETLRTLRQQEMNQNSVLHAGQKVFLRLTANLSLGGSTDDITDEVPQKHKDIAIAGAKALGLRFAGVDIICMDATSEETESYIIEINSGPGMRIHYSNEKGRKRNIAQQILQTTIQN
jgi:cyanophycin synthetase